MGFYINPSNMTKEEWLKQHGVPMAAPIDFEVMKDRKPPEFYPVCLVNNGWMTAAGIAFDQGEHLAFIGDNSDRRPKKWYLVPRDKLVEVCPSVEGALK